MRDLTYQQAFDFMNEIYEYDFCTDESNVTAQIRTDLELLCMKAILKQIPESPVHIHEVYPKHDWGRDKDGGIDMWAYESGYCNGPICRRCYHSVCVHCEPNWNDANYDECVIDEYRCPDCNQIVAKNRKFCPECGQALDWSANEEYGK